MSTHLRHFGARCSDCYRLDGLRVVVLENERLRVSILADQGTDIFEFLYKPLDVDFLLRTPNGIRNRARYAASWETDHSFMDYYEGGWQEIFPHGSAPTVYQGARIGQHGEVWGLPWAHKIELDTPEEVRVRFQVRTVRTPFLIEKTLCLRSGEATLNIDERVTNEGTAPFEFMWGHHIAFGPPFLDGDCVIDAPAGRVRVDGIDHPWPIGADGVDHARLIPVGREDEQMKYLLDLRQGWYAFTNLRRAVGFGAVWDPAVFDSVWVWQEFGYTKGYPWYGRVHATALEPFSSLPRAHEEGTRLLRLEGGQSLRTLWKVLAYECASRVAAIDPDGRVTPIDR
jgi:hypothetical protein